MKYECLNELINLKKDSNLIDFLPNENNINSFKSDDLEYFNQFAGEYLKIERRKKGRTFENKRKKILMRNLLEYLKNLDDTYNTYYFTLKIMGFDYLNRLDELYSDLYKKNYFDDSIYNF